MKTQFKDSKPLNGVEEETITEKNEEELEAVPEKMPGNDEEDEEESEEEEEEKKTPAKELTESEKLIQSEQASS